MSSGNGSRPGSETAARAEEGQDRKRWKAHGRDRANVRIPPPFVYVAVVLAAIVLEKATFPLVPPGAAPPIVWRGLAVLTFLWGCWLTGVAFLGFLRTKQNPEPWKPTPELIVDGIYRISRNPMYVGMAGWQMALGFVWQSLWVVVLTPLSLAGVYLVAVRHEEAYLQAKFGEAYVEYKSTVRRWL